MNQIIFIHGWVAFDNQQQYHDFLLSEPYEPYKWKQLRWKDSLQENMWESYQCLLPSMPAKQNADYEAWKIWFEKVLVYINTDKTIFIWHSLWAIFLTKYLSENDFPKKINQLHIVSPVFDNSWLYWEWVWNFELKNFQWLKNIGNKADTIFIYHSRDDFVVPYQHSQKYLQYLPRAVFESFEDRGHFLQAQFPELIENIKNNIN